jgi:homoserine kinase
MDEVTIEVPSSSANVGLGYDIWCLGLDRPKLSVTYTRLPRRGIEVEVKSHFKPPEGRFLGHAGKAALENLLQEMNIDEGGHLLFEDSSYGGYPVGGLGRSGAEAVGAVLAGAVINKKRLTRDQVIQYAAKGEPGEHKDNVAASTNGRFNIVVQPPHTIQPKVLFHNVPQNLGIMIGRSSHQKTTGTEGMRKVLQEPISTEDYVAQIGLVSAATACLIGDDVDGFLELVWGDRFHEPRRANIGGYGRFNAEDFVELKHRLWKESSVALNVSGAGPSMQILFNSDRPTAGIALNRLIVPWFAERGIKLDTFDAYVAKKGAYDYAQSRYAWNV